MHISILKKHKILLLVLLSFMLTGCSVDYTLELNDKVKETIKVNAPAGINEVEQELEVLTPVLDVYEDAISNLSGSEKKDKTIINGFKETVKRTVKGVFHGKDSSR